MKQTVSIAHLNWLENIELVLKGTGVMVPEVGYVGTSSTALSIASQVVEGGFERLGGMG
jgi:hypothetical protein